MRSLPVKKLLIAIPVLLVGFILYRQANLEGEFRVISTHVENFAAIDVENGRTNYEDIKGKTTLIVLSASWCPACMAEIPMLKKLHSEFYKSGLRILMVSEDDNAKIAARFKKKHDIPWTVIHWNYDLMNILGNPGYIPVSYLVNASDSIVQIHSGIFDEEDVREKVQELLEQ